MPLLYLAQSEEGRVTREGLREVAGLLDLTTAEVEAVATFYTMYRLRPTGEHLVNVCTNLACMLRGGKDVYEAAHEAAGMAHGQEISDDGLITAARGGVPRRVRLRARGADRLHEPRQRDPRAHARADRRAPRRRRAEPARGPKMQSFRHASRVLAGLEAPAERGAA